jgi:hypothetical protein
VCCVAQSIKKKSSLSDTRFTKARERVYVIFRGKTYKIATHVHSHPGTGPSNNPLQISQMDLNMIKNVNASIHIIQNKSVYSVSGSYNYQTNMYNYKEIKFTW